VQEGCLPPLLPSPGAPATPPVEEQDRAGPHVDTHEEEWEADLSGLDALGLEGVDLEPLELAEVRDRYGGPL
jgi:hypothetical protein